MTGTPFARRVAPLLIPLAAALVAAAPADQAAHSAAFDAAVASAKQGMMGDPAQALRAADQALALARAFPDSRGARISIATAQWLDGEAHLFLNQEAAAAPLIAAALATAAREAPGTKLLGDLMRSQGAIAEGDGRAQDALRAYQRGYDIFTAAHEDRSRALALQDMGHIYRSAGDYERTLRYYQQSAEIYSREPRFLLLNHNSMGELLKELHRPREAEQHLTTALAIARQEGGVTLQLRVLTNLADVQIDAGELAAADRSVAHALKLSRDPGAAEWRSPVLGIAAKLAATRGQTAQAAGLLDEMFKGQDLTATDGEFVDAHRLAARVYEQVGQPQLALRHIEAYQRLDSAARKLTASYGAQLASARFDFVNQNARIAALKTQRLQQEVQLERQHARMRTIITAAVLTIALGVLGFLSFALVTGRRSRDRLRGINTQLERALKAKTEFLAMTSHEIRTPLNGILGMTQVMLAEPTLQDGVRDRLRLVHGAGETMRALVDDILDVSKMENGEIELVEEDADLGRVLDDLAGLWADQARAKGVALTCDHVQFIGRLRLDPSRVRQVLFNLLSNAVKFTEAGRIDIVAHAVPGDTGERLVVTISDTGIGIDPAQHELIFQPFQQADASTTRRFGGTGLGLAISRRLAIAMGGTITVDSTLGQGACFTLTLPLRRAASQAATHVAREPTTDLAAAHVLLVEANPVAQGVLGGLLERHVGRLFVAGDRDEAMAVLAMQRVDHLLIEAGSAAVDGEPAAGLRQLVGWAEARAIKTTVLTSPAATVPIEQVIAVGADQIVMKPIAGGALLARLRDLYAPVLAAQAA